MDCLASIEMGTQLGDGGVGQAGAEDREFMAGVYQSADRFGRTLDPPGILRDSAGQIDECPAGVFKRPKHLLSIRRAGRTESI